MAVNQSNPREKEIFEHALDLESAEERLGYLQGACVDDAVLLARVRALLQAHDEASRFLPDAPGGGVERTLAVHPSSDAAPGDRIGRYKLLEKIGEGGCGMVYMAEQEEPVRRRVALKVIKLGMDTKSVIARFESERQALAMMDHPNIAKVLEAGSTERPLTGPTDTLSPGGGEGRGEGEAGKSQIVNRESEIRSGRPYFVMELVRGVKITEYCDEARLSTRDRLDLFIKVCQAIQHAHQKGIIHRDIKPSNILVTINDGVAVPKVIDFGIAKATEGRLTDKTLFTQFEALIGTPAYMSPEQAVMTSLDIDTRSDIYSLGVLLYELLAGSTPFDAKELMASGLDEMRRTIREKEPLKPSTKLSQTLLAADAARVRNAECGTRSAESPNAELQNQNSAFPTPHSALDPASSRRLLRIKETITLLRGDLDWIVMKCLEKDRARRYETANGLASDIQRHLNNEAILARPASAAYRFQKMVRRNKLAFAAASAIAAVLVLGVIVSAWQAVRATRSQQNEAKHRQIADEARQNEGQLRVRAEAQELVARQRAYASDMNLAQQALALNNLGRAQELLNRQRPPSGEQDLRGWEWRYLWQQCRSDALFTLCHMTNGVGPLSASADGKRLAVCEGSGLSIWDLKTRRAIVRLPAGEGQIAGEGQVHAAFSPQDSFLAFSVASRQSSTNWQYSIRLLNSETRAIVADLPLQSACLGLAFSGDGRTLVTSTAGEQGQIALWRMPEGKKLASYPVPQAPFVWTAFAVGPDLSVAAHMTPGNKVRVIDLASGRERWSAKAAEENLTALALSSDGKMLASGAAYTESSIRLWDVATGTQISRLEGHRSFIAALLFWPDGRTLASASGDQTIRLWDLSNPANVPPPRVLRGHKLEVHHLALLPDHGTLVSGCKDGSVCFWDTTLSRQQSTRITLLGTFSAWRFDPESTSVVTLARNGGVARWKGISFQEIEPLIDIGTNVGTALISADTRLLAAGSKQGRICVWDLRRGEFVREWSNGIAPEPFAFLAAGKRLGTIDRGDGVHREWDLTTGKETQSWRGAAELVWDCTPTLSSDERWCLTLNSGGAGFIRDMPTGSERSFNLNLVEVNRATFSPDGKLLAVASGQGPAKLWEVTPLQEVATLRGVILGVHSVAFSPDSKRLAIGSSGIEAIKLWDVEGLQELLTLEGEGSVFYRTAFSPDGNVLGSMNKAGMLHLWRAPSWEEVATAEAKEKTESKQP